MWHLVPVVQITDLCIAVGLCSRPAVAKKIALYELDCLAYFHLGAKLKLSNDVLLLCFALV